MAVIGGLFMFFAHVFAVLQYTLTGQAIGHTVSFITTYPGLLVSKLLNLKSEPLLYMFNKEIILHFFCYMSPSHHHFTL